MNAGTRIRALSANPNRDALFAAVRGSASSKAIPQASLSDHLESTLRWLCRAQDATADGGVSGYYDLWSGRWSSSYPETTGYIIPTLLSCAEAGLPSEIRDRALRMADWSSEVQLGDGAVLSGLLTSPSGRAVFNTGQAIFGWIAAYQVSGRQRYADSARRACEWLLRHQEADGAWRRHLSVLTTAPVHSYNVRCAWALSYAARTLDEPAWQEAAIRAADWALRQQNAVGWFAHTGFAPDEVPLLHTISYVIEGLLGVYAFSGDERYLDAARRALHPILERHREGRLGGRLDARWQPTVRWRCVTGDAQIGLVALRMETHAPGQGYHQAGMRLVEEVAGIQQALLGGRAMWRGGPTVGGIPGSFPVWGEYMRLALPNWGAKFFLDALLLVVQGHDEYGWPGLPA